MTGRLQYNFYDLSKLPLPGSTLAIMIADAICDACIPHHTERDCCFGPSRDPDIRACRIAWRTTFRTIRNRDLAREKTLRSESDGKRDRAPAIGRTRRDGYPAAQQKEEHAA